MKPEKIIVSLLMKLALSMLTKNQSYIKKINFGQSVVEVVVAVSIFLIIAGSSVITILGSLDISRLAEDQGKAIFYANEAIEATKSIRNQSWNLLVDGTYGLTDNNGYWEFSGSSDSLPDGFTRETTVSSVQRDESWNITQTGTPDEDTKLITTTVSWTTIKNNSSSVTTSVYLTNWQEYFPIRSCAIYCQNNSYSAGTCRNPSSACAASGETYETAGDQYCTFVANEKYCCCNP